MITGFKAAFAVALLAGYAAAAFFPFRWQWPAALNRAEPDLPRSLRFPGPGILRTQAPPPWIAAAKRGQSLEIALQARSFSQSQTGPARVLTNSLNPYRRNLTLAQDGADLVVRLRTPETDRNGLPAHRVAGVFRDSAWKDIAVSIGAERLSVAVDGQVVHTSALPPAPLSNWDTAYLLALGNELTNDRPWRGEVRRALIRVGDLRVDYLAPGALHGPALLWREVNLRLTPFKDLTPRDALINFFGFIPLGIFLALWTGRARPVPDLALVALIASTSLVLELLQLGFVGRYTSTSDLLLNTAGGTAGLIVLGLHRSRRSKR